jgi:hypothetical protein
MNPFHPLASCSFKMCFNVILSPLLMFSRYSPSLRVCHQNSYVFCSLYACLGTQRISTTCCEQYKRWSTIYAVLSCLVLLSPFISKSHFMSAGYLSLFIDKAKGLEGRCLGSEIFRFFKIPHIRFDMFINCNWVVTRWQYTFTHKQYIEQHK